MFVASVDWFIFCAYPVEFWKLLQQSVKLQLHLPTHLHGNFTLKES